MSQSRHERNVRILGIYCESPDGVRIAQAHELPSLAGIERLPHTISANDVAPDARFPGPDINHIRIRLGNSNRANRRRRIFRLVENRFPVESAVGRLPHPASYRAKIVDLILPHHARHRNHASAAEWPH